MRPKEVPLGYDHACGRGHTNSEYFSPFPREGGRGDGEMVFSHSLLFLPLSFYISITISVILADSCRAMLRVSKHGRDKSGIVKI